MTSKRIFFGRLYNSLWAIFVVLVCLIAGLSFYEERMAEYNSPVLSANNNLVDAAALLVSRKIAEVETTMRVFKTETTILQPDLPELVNSFKVLFDVYPDIMQVRWLDADGYEQIRLDKNEQLGLVIETKASNLQDKSNRYYFTAGTALDENELFLSQIDLNVENGVIQTPIQPTIRAVSKASHRELGNGMLVINYNLKSLLQNLRLLNDPNTSIKIAAGTTRWVVHPDRSKEWSPDLKLQPANILIDEPALWHQITTNSAVPNQVIANHLYATLSIPSSYTKSGGLQDIHIVAKSRDGLLSDFRYRAIRFAGLASMLIAIIGYLVWFIYAKHYRKLKTLSDQLAQEKITLKKALEQQTYLISELAESKKLSSLSIMIAGLAHELNTPVGATQLALSNQSKQLQALLNLIKTGLTREAFEQSIEGLNQSLGLAQDNNQRAIELIRGFKRLTFERAKDQVQLFNVLNVINDLVRSMRGLLKKKGVDVVVDINDNFEINGFSGAFSQIIQMIIVNALEHAFHSTQSGQISIRAERQEACLVVYIKDNGKGIPDDVIPHLFEPFYTTRRNSQHTGLGLHLAQVWIQQAFDGEIKVNSKLKVGAEFILRFCHVSVPADNSPDL